MTRLDFEKEEMRLLCPQFSLFSERGKTGWKGDLKGYQFRIFYPANYPTVGPEVHEMPSISTSHRLHGLLCLWRPEQWNPNWTAATVVGIILRFLDDYSKGKV
jgi:ubiquitin-protein ligase